MSDNDLYNLQLDKWNLITEEGDGGDSCNRSCVYSIVKSWMGEAVGGIDIIIDYFTHPWALGFLRRHPDTTKWYGEWNRMSRDQTYPYLMACKEYKLYMKAFDYILGHYLRLFLFTTNIKDNGYTGPGLKLPDITGPDFWSVEIRALPTFITVLFYPILHLFDLYTLLSAVYLRYFNKEQTDVINHVMLSIFSQRNCPTIFTWLMNKFINNANDLQTRLDTFFAYKYQPKMNLLVKPLVLQYFS